MMLVAAVPAPAYTTGTYTGTGTGMLDKIEVAVTFDADKITGIEVLSCNDTPGVCDAAVEKIPEEIVKYQSLGVDVATSATFTSNGILEAVADAVAQAGGYYQAAHPDYLQYASLTEGQKEEIERYISLEPKDERMASWQAKVKEQYAEHPAAGHDYLFDSPELHMIQTYDGGDYLGDSELIEMMCYGDIDSMNWLSDHGFTWKKSTVAIVGSIWMRCKASDTYASGQGFINVINDAIQNEKLDVTTVFECRGEHLVTDDTGRVVGVTGVSTADGTPYTVSANKGVILASGSFWRERRNASGVRRNPGEPDRSCSDHQRPDHHRRRHRHGEGKEGVSRAIRLTPFSKSVLRPSVLSRNPQKISRTRR